LEYNGGGGGGGGGGTLLVIFQRRTLSAINISTVLLFLFVGQVAVK
jgi:hypothetical protein